MRRRFSPGEQQGLGADALSFGHCNDNVGARLIGFRARDDHLQTFGNEFDVVQRKCHDSDRRSADAISSASTARSRTLRRPSPGQDGGLVRRVDAGESIRSVSQSMLRTEIATKARLRVLRQRVGSDAEASR